MSSCVITSVETRAEATIPKKKTTTDQGAGHQTTPDALDDLGLSARIVSLLRAGGLTSVDKIDAASLKACAGIGPAIAAKVLDALSGDTSSEAETGSDAGMDQGVGQLVPALEPEEAVEQECEEAVEEDGIDLETSLLRTDRAAASEASEADLLFAASRTSKIEETAEGPPAIVPIFGGHLLIERLSDDRRRVRCDDPWMSERFSEACSNVNATVSAEGTTVLPYDTCKLLVAALKDPSARRELRAWTHEMRHPPSLVTAHGRIKVAIFGTSAGPVAVLTPLDKDGRIENRMDLVCPKLGGRWSDEKGNWSIPEGRLPDLMKAMNILPAGAPPAPAEIRRAAAAERRPPAAEKDGLAYAIDENGKADKDWYRRSGRRDSVEVLGGMVHIYHVDERTWVAAKHDGDGLVNAAIKDALARVSGHHGYHGPLNGHKFPAKDATGVVAELMRIDAAGRPTLLV